MEKPDRSKGGPASFAGRHPIIANILIIIAVAILGILIVYFSIAIFTRHGQSRRVPGVENTSYTDAIEKIHEAGLRYEIRDSLYRDDVRPGYVIEQFPKRNSIVKPGRKIFLYINAVSPKQVVIDDGNRPREYALAGSSERSALARLEELGFKKVKIVRVLGTNDMVIRIMANGMPVRKTQRVPVNASIVVEISDGRLMNLRDSLTNLENTVLHSIEQDQNPEYEETGGEGYGENSEYLTPVEPESPGENESEENEWLQ